MRSSLTLLLALTFLLLAAERAVGQDEGSGAEEGSGEEGSAEAEAAEAEVRVARLLEIGHNMHNLH